MNCFFTEKTTLIVSKGWPAITRHIPPNPPAMKFCKGLITGGGGGGGGLPDSGFISEDKSLIYFRN